MSRLYILTRHCIADSAIRFERGQLFGPHSVQPQPAAHPAQLPSAEDDGGGFADAGHRDGTGGHLDLPAAAT